MSGMHEATVARRASVMNQIYASGDVSTQTQGAREFIRFEEAGCVVRAFESAFGVGATLEELRMRADDIDELTADARELPVFADLEGKEAKKRIIHQMDRFMITRYIERVSEHKTPLGEAMRAHTFTQTTLTSAQINEALQDDATILLSIDRPKTRHLAHIKKVEGNIVQVSDDDEVVHLEEQKTHDVILISSKQ